MGYDDLNARQASELYKTSFSFELGKTLSVNFQYSTKIFREIYTYHNETIKNVQHKKKKIDLQDNKWY